MVRTFDHRDTCCRKQLDLIDGYHHREHAEYEPRHGPYPMREPMFVHLETSSRDLEHGARRDPTSFVTDSVRLSFVTSHLIVNEVNDISSNGCTENGGQNDGAAS